MWCAVSLFLFISEGNSGIICNRSGSNICCATGRERAAIRRGRIWSCWGEIRICLMSCSAARLQSMKWYLTEREYREEEEWLTGELEDEYGLIPEIRLLAENADYGRVRLQGTKPCVVLDFCDNEKVYGSGLAAGSIWLDFPASEDKEHRALVQCPQIRYFSMKKEWKDPRKAREYLDTISKNGYNNSVD